MYGLIKDNDDLDIFSDQEIIAKTIWGEARNQEYIGQQAVCNVIFNRAKRPRWWGCNPRSVCLHAFQFSCWNNSDPNRSKIVEVTAHDPIYSQCLSLAGFALADDLADVSGGADSYQVIGTNAYWAKGLNPVVTIGRHEFFKTA